MSNKLTFRALMKKYGDGEINEETKICFIDAFGSQDEKTLKSMINFSKLLIGECHDFEIVEKNKKVFEFKLSHEQDYIKFKKKEITHLNVYFVISSIPFEEYNNGLSQKAFLHETREIEI